jgi:hypothetical protein
VSPVRYELGFYIPDDILHSHRRENLKSYMPYILIHKTILLIFKFPIFYIWKWERRSMRNGTRRVAARPHSQGQWGLGDDGTAGIPHEHCAVDLWIAVAGRGPETVQLSGDGPTVLEQADGTASS